MGGKEHPSMGLPNNLTRRKVVIFRFNEKPLKGMRYQVIEEDILCPFQGLYMHVHIHPYITERARGGEQISVVNFEVL